MTFVGYSVHEHPLLCDLYDILLLVLISNSEIDDEINQCMSTYRSPRMVYDIVLAQLNYFISVVSPKSRVGTNLTPKVVQSTL